MSGLTPAFPRTGAIRCRARMSAHPRHTDHQPMRTIASMAGYGGAALAGSGGSRRVSENGREGARSLGQHVAQVAAKLAGSPLQLTLHSAASGETLPGQLLPQAADGRR